MFEFLWTQKMASTRIKQPIYPDGDVDNNKVYADIIYNFYILIN